MASGRDDEYGNHSQYDYESYGHDGGFDTFDKRNSVFSNLSGMKLPSFLSVR